MDEALTTVSLDLSGRPYLVYNVDISGKSGDFDVELIEEFFRAVSTYGGITLHINNLYGGNNHHIIESAFKAFTRALSEASEIISDNIPSSKGMLE
jgi:imidazoleglycerol-phosphate dehydratase